MWWFIVLDGEKTEDIDFRMYYGEANRRHESEFFGGFNKLWEKLDWN